MKLIDKITRVVITIAVAMLILSMFCRCKTKERVIENRHTSLINVTRLSGIHSSMQDLLKSWNHIKYRTRNP